MFQRAWRAAACASRPAPHGRSRTGSNRWWRKKASGDNQRDCELHKACKTLRSFPRKRESRRAGSPLSRGQTEEVFSRQTMANTLSPDEKDVYKIVRAVRDLFEGR